MSPSEKVALLGGIAGLMVIVLGWVGWLRPRVRRGSRLLVAALETLAGRGEILDEATGETLPAIMPLHRRLNHLQRDLDAVAEAQASTAKALEILAAVQADQTAHGRSLADHEARILSLEDIDAERARTLEYTTAMWRALADKDVIDVDPEEVPRA